jgi:hypothetical protein
LESYYEKKRLNTTLKEHRAQDTTFKEREQAYTKEKDPCFSEHYSSPIKLWQRVNSNQEAKNVKENDNVKESQETREDHQKNQPHKIK